MSSSPSFLIAGGGTGGHLLPGVALARELQHLAPNARITFQVPGRPVDRAIMARENFPWYTCQVRSLGRSLPQVLPSIYALFKGLGETAALLRRVRPHMVIGLGGYGSWPAGVLAALSNIPLILLEQNAVAGKVTRMLACQACAVLGPWPLENIPGSLVQGVPLRSEVLQGNPQRLGLQAGKPTLLIMGGSQGARRLNETMLRFLEYGGSQARVWQYIHLTGPADEEELRRAYQQHHCRAYVRAFDPQMGDLYQAADVVLCRAGGSTLAELTALGLPAILVPLPHAAHDHQRVNAAKLTQQGAALTLAEEDCTPAALGANLQHLLAPTVRARMARAAKLQGRPRAAQTIAQNILAWQARYGRQPLRLRQALAWPTCRQV